MEVVKSKRIPFFVYQRGSCVVVQLAKVDHAAKRLQITDVTNGRDCARLRIHELRPSMVNDENPLCNGGDLKMNVAVFFEDDFACLVSDTASFTAEEVANMVRPRQIHSPLQAYVDPLIDFTFVVPWRSRVAAMAPIGLARQFGP